METSRLYGATPGEWKSAENSPLMPWIIPIISNPNVPSSACSRAMRNGRGKVPSEKNTKGEAVGLRNWTNRAGNTDLSAWNADPDYGFGVRLGRGGLVAVDCDCDDPGISESIREMLFSAIGAAPPLRRRGSARWACILRLSGRECVQKRKYTLPVGILEVLGDGQQLACAGTHPSGARYEWEGGAVGDVAETTIEQFETFCNAVEAVYGGASPIKPRVIGDTFAAKDPLADWLREKGHVHGEGREGELYIECPWEDTHSDKGGETSTCYFPVGSNGYEKGGFKCLHAHCTEKGMAEFLAACKAEGYSETKAGDYPDMSAADMPKVPAEGKTTLQALMAFVNERSGKIRWSREALEIALSDPSFCGLEFGYDEFPAGIVTRAPGGEWKEYQDEVVSEMVLTLEKQTTSIKSEPCTPTDKAVEAVIKMIANRATAHFDSMTEYLAKHIPEWDGVSRVSHFFTDYCGAEKTEWTSSVSLYLFTALWARASCTDPDGVKADITPVIIGKQGTGKSTLARILALDERWCADMDFSLNDSDRIRVTRRKVIMEIPELGGMRKREQNDVKAFMTRKVDEWVPKFREGVRRAPRRYVSIMTTNDKDFLTDSTGNRRWAPVEVGNIDRDAVKRDVLQLWAEGRELFRQNGVMYEVVEQLQNYVNTAYEVRDPWCDILEAWFAENNDVLKTTRNIVESGLRRSYAVFERRESTRLAVVLRALGHERVKRWVDGKAENVWE